jgi:GTP cyclohydrolase I
MLNHPTSDFAPDSSPIANGSEDAVTREQAEAAVRILLTWVGEDPTREGLRDTPARVARSYRELFGGYRRSAAGELQRTFMEVGAPL